MADERRSIELEGRAYDVEVHRRVAQGPDAPRLVLVSYLPNESARAMLFAALDAYERFTPEPHELWVADNNSPESMREALRARAGVNLVLSRTEPAPPGRRGAWTWLTGGIRQSRWGSYANAVGLELAARVVDPATRRLMTLHMDTAPCRAGWLSFLTGKLDAGAAAAGVRLDRYRVPDGVLHVLGMMLDFQRVRTLGTAFWPELPGLDVGDRMSVALRAAGHSLFACRNTHTDPKLAEELPEPYRDLPVDRALDDQGRVVHLHLGRGLVKSERGPARGISSDEWVEFLRALVRG